MIRNYTIGELKMQFARLGYKWPKEQYSLIGIRAPIKSDNLFDDLLIFIDMGDPTKTVWPVLTYGIATTIPGRYYLLNLMNPKGAAILKEGQYLNSWKVGLHNGYTAFIQNAPITVYRDNLKTGVVSETKGTEGTGMFGIDIHRAASGFVAKFIDNFSAGCQVWEDPAIFNKVIAIAEKATQKTYTYTLLNEF